MAIGSDTRRVLWGALAAIVLLPLLFHAGMILGGREPLAPDTQAVRPLGVWATETQHEMGRVPLWIPYLFSGMPSYGSYIYTPASPFSPLDWVTRPLSGERGLRYYAYMLLGGLAAFAFFRRQGRSIPASAAVALAFVMTPYIPGVIGAGHSTKLKALMHVPLVLLALDVFLDRPGPLATAFLALSVAMLGWANHPQILYYAAIIAVLYAIGRILAERAVWTGGRLLLAAIWGIVGLFVAFLLIAEPTLAVREYAPYSVRGATEEGGAEWRYATDWSFAPRETISFLFPEFYGLQGETYFGPLPFTQSTHYFGILMLLAVVFGLARARTPRSWIWLVISLVILFVGFGRYLPILYGPFYKLLPYFNRFRVPSMFYSLLPLTLGYLTAVGIDALIRPGPAARSAPAARSGKPAAPAA
ncbi:MAG: hypothetical protein QUU85_13400, partial [Candidatus Eisenbacteria bacterium]|nr:hypothetical protein [Candidatus Eisenbacteria bacterium]